MRRTWLIGPVLLISVISGAYLQNADAQTQWWPFVSVGYWNARSDISDYYQEVLGYYRDNGIPIPTQTDFGRTLCVNGGILVSRKSTIKFGISIGYRYSPAYSSYADYAGTLKVNGSLNTFEIGLILKATMAEWWGFPVILSFEPGLGHLYAAILEEVRYSGVSRFNTDTKWTASAWGYQCRMMLGTSLPVGQFAVGVNVGYQASLTESTNMKKGNVPIILNQSGPVLLVSLGFTL